MSDVVELERVADKRGGDMSDKREWKLDDAARARIDEAYEEIDSLQSRDPQCVVCGQRCRVLDKHGCCSKTSEIHAQHRNELRTAGKR